MHIHLISGICFALIISPGLLFPDTFPDNRNSGCTFYNHIPAVFPFHF